MSFTNRQKCEALVASGLASDMEEALIQLCDMGEYDPGDESLDEVFDGDTMDRLLS